MATFKHISSKNADYGAAEQYLTFEHDEFTMKPTLDENGRLVPREDYRLATLNCGDEDFAVACMRSNLRYGKNQKREDVKSHHYIISFDPRDGTDNGLTVDKAQSLGEEFCKEHFPGHQAIAPQEYADRNTLWNAAEAVEKQWNSQLARRWVLTIPREIPPDQYAVLVREFCEQQFVSKGMIADFAIHDPHPPGHNPHAHDPRRPDAG